MSWKIFAVFVKPHNDKNVEEVLHELGYNKLIPTEAATVEDVLYPEDDEVYAGHYKDNLVICSQGLPEDFVGKTDLSVTEEKLIEIFPESDILAVILHGTTNAYGYALIEKGKKTRLKAGHAEKAVVTNHGDLLAEEKILMEYASEDEHGDLLFQFEEDGEIYPEHAVGEEFVFHVASRFLGVNMDEATEFLENTRLNGYKIDVSLDDELDVESLSAEDDEAENIDGEKASVNWGTVTMVLIIIAAILGVIFFF